MYIFIYIICVYIYIYIGIPYWDIQLVFPTGIDISPIPIVLVLIYSLIFLFVTTDGNDPQGMETRSASRGEVIPSFGGSLEVVCEPIVLHQRITYFIGKTTYSKRKFDIINPNKCLI